MSDPLTDEQRWIDAGLLDPASETADERRELLRWMDAQGITLDQMVRSLPSGSLTTLAGDLALRPGPRLTLAEVAGRMGLPLAAVDALRQASGYPPSDDEAVYTDADLLMFGLFDTASTMFSRSELMHFTRVVGSSIRRIAEAASEMFLQDVEAPIMASGGSTELQRAIKNLEAIQLAGAAEQIFEPMFRAHLELAVLAARAARADSWDYATTTLSVGFVDLSGFTSRSERLSPQALLDLVLDFETQAYNLVTDHGGRLVKLIGDEVMFTTHLPPQACDIARQLVAHFRGADGESARGGVAYGPVVTHGGDLYGDTVNLAARLADIAVPGEILVTGRVAEQLAASAVAAAGRRLLKGFAEPVALWSLETV